MTYDGITYLFPGTESRNLFIRNPQKYAPVLNGDSIVEFAKSGKRIPGTVKYATLHKNRVYLFANADERKEFHRNVRRYEIADIAFSGNCPVCMVDGEKEVRGKRQYSTQHCGLRYFFPSEQQKLAFLRNPARYVKQLKSSQKTSPAKSTTTTRTTSTVSVSGRTGCAACEHGVHPIGAPDELGLAVIDGSGHVFVVEDAHRLYPNLYKNRFDGHSVQLVGEVVKETSKATWVKVRSLKTARQSTT